ncbi:MAG: amidase [Myxococcales bacterium]|nr:amidase [Myxococcales bacterium]
MSDSSPLAFCDATEIARRIRDGELSALECLEYFLGRVQRFESLNAVVVLDAERARRQAREADALRARGQSLGPLHGVPMTIKESFDVAGLATTWGDPNCKDNVAQTDAIATARLKAAGAVIFGKTNVPLQLSDFQSYNAIYGTTNNPWDLERSPGGSSGGESAALAAGLSSLGLGSDIGGSIRNPSHYSGVFGHKASYGIIAHNGHSTAPTAAASDLGAFGPLARSARDLRLALKLVAGPGPLQQPGWQLTLPEADRTFSQLRVAVWADDPQAPVSAEVAARCRQLGEVLEKAGARVSLEARPAFDAVEAYSCYRKLLASALSARQSDEVSRTQRRAATAFSADDDGPAARAAWNAVMPHRLWLQLHEQRSKLRGTWQAFFEDWDLLICPVAPTPAFAHDHRPFHERAMMVDGETRAYFEQLFWAGLATLSYLPSTVIPTGPGRAGLPIGVQLVGPQFHDLRTIDVAEKLAALGFGFQPPPGYAD